MGDAYLSVGELLQIIQGQNKEIEDLKARVERLERRVATEEIFRKECSTGSIRVQVRGSRRSRTASSRSISILP